MKITTLVGTRLEHLMNVRRSRAALEARRLDRFRRLVAYAAERSPYYREIVRDRGIDVTRSTPADFPVLTKSELMRNFDRIVTDPRITRRKVTEFLEASKDPFDLLEGEFYVVHTSGSSGEVGLFVYSSAEWTRGVAHSLRINPFRPRKRRIAFFGATNGHFAGATIASTSRRPFLRHFYDVQLFEINSPFGPVIDGLNALQPDILLGYSSALALLAQRQLRGELAIRPRWIQSSGEPVQAGDRAIVEAAFGVPLVNVYASTEHLVMGCARPEYDGMYLFEDDLIFELKTDHTVVTNLFNFTLPLIRYRMSDVLVEKPDPKPVLPFLKIEEVVGRNEHIPVFVNERGEEDFISPHTINEFIVPNVRRFQLVVHDRSGCKLRVCLEGGLADAQRARALEEADLRLRQLFANKEMRNVAVEIEEVAELPADPRTGKFRLIVPAAPAAA